MLVSDAVIDSLERYAHLAPLHNPPNLIGIRAAMSKLPGVPQVAVFDTAFHTTIPEVAYTYALPHDLCKKHGIRRYGFHGTSHRYVTQRTAQLMDIPENKINCITTHLGNGCSMAAVRNGQSVDTSMGLTPLEGLVMGTRTGDFDPAILFYLSDHGYDIDELKAICNKKSGMLGISGESNDMRTLSALAAEGNDRAQLAIDIFCYRVKKYIGMYMAVLGRVDSVVFTGGIGENNAAVRSSICSELDELGITIDVDLNAKTIRGGEGPITTADSRTSVLVVPTDEEAAIAADTYEIVGSGQ